MYDTLKKRKLKATIKNFIIDFRLLKLNQPWDIYRIGIGKLPLCRVRSEGCSREAMERTARNGHLEVVKFLHDIGATCTSTAIHLAQVHGHNEVHQFLNTMYPGKVQYSYFARSILPVTHI